MTDDIRIFFDTEFTDLSIDAKLISIGFVDQTGERTFYVEVSDTWRHAEASEFTRVEVLPLLQGGQHLMTMDNLGRGLSEWLASFDRSIVLATDSLAWDWPWINRILETQGLWPSNLAKEPLLLNMNYLVEYDRFVDAVENGFATGLRRHHALDDALSNRLGWIASGGDILCFPQDVQKEN